MALNHTIDSTSDFNTNGKVNIDTNGWDTANVQIQTPSGTINFNGSNDANAITGISDGNARTAINWQAAQGVNTANGLSVTSTASNGIFKFSYPSRFLQFIGSSVTVNKLIIVLSKID